MKISRRHLLTAAAAAPALASTMPLRASTSGTVPLGKAEHCIFIWLGGGAAQMDTWDPKAKGDAKAKKAGVPKRCQDSFLLGREWILCIHGTTETCRRSGRDLSRLEQGQRPG